MNWQQKMCIEHLLPFYFKGLYSTLPCWPHNLLSGSATQTQRCEFPSSQRIGPFTAPSWTKPSLGDKAVSPSHSFNTEQRIDILSSKYVSYHTNVLICTLSVGIADFKSLHLKSQYSIYEQPVNSTFLAQAKRRGCVLPALAHSKLFLSPQQERVTSKRSPFPCPPRYQLEWASGDLLASSSHSNYHTDSPAFVAGFQGSPLQWTDRTEQSVHC